MTLSSYNRRRKQQSKSNSTPGMPSKERSCDTCRRRKVRCSESRPACAQCLKSAALKGIPASEVKCEYSVRSIFFQAHGAEGGKTKSGETAAHAVSGHHQHKMATEKGQEADDSDAEDDGRSSSTLSSSRDSPFDAISSPSTAGTSPPTSPTSRRSSICPDPSEDDQLGDVDAEGETDYESDLFEERPILSSSLLAAPPPTPCSSSFILDPHPKQPPPQLARPFIRPSATPPTAAPRPLVNFGAVPSNPQSYSGITHRAPLPPPLRSDGTPAFIRADFGADFWAGGVLTREEVLGWGSLQQCVWKASWRGMQ